MFKCSVAVGCARRLSCNWLSDTCCPRSKLSWNYQPLEHLIRVIAEKMCKFDHYVQYTCMRSWKYFRKNILGTCSCIHQLRFSFMWPQYGKKLLYERWNCGQNGLSSETASANLYFNWSWRRQVLAGGNFSIVKPEKLKQLKLMWS